MLRHQDGGFSLSLVSLLFLKKLNTDLLLVAFLEKLLIVEKHILLKKSNLN